MRGAKPFFGMWDLGKIAGISEKSLWDFGILISVGFGIFQNYIGILGFIIKSSGILQIFWRYAPWYDDTNFF